MSAWLEADMEASVRKHLLKMKLFLLGKQEVGLRMKVK
jgi:hypothetical protein